LEEYAKNLERMEVEGLWEPRLRDVLIEQWLAIRTKTPNETSFTLNRAQRDYSRRCGKQNIVLKARQLGITTYIAARFFMQTITQRGTLSVQVAQNQESAEDIFRIVRRFWDGLPEDCREGALITSRRNKRQLVFPHLDSEYCVESATENGRARTDDSESALFGGCALGAWGRRGTSFLTRCGGARR
jgi:hypothetical protein